ncbi:MAG: metal-sensitive transcriptional regulator [Christensenellales bacterium]
MDNLIKDNGEKAVKTDLNNKCEGCNERKTVREEKLKAALVRRLSCVEGQVRGIKGMIEKDTYCEDVLNQITAAKAALTSVSKLVMENHIHGCLLDRIHEGDDGVVDELIRIIGRML